MSFQFLVVILLVNTSVGLYYKPIKVNYKLPYRLPLPKSQYPVCGFLHGVWKTFASLNEFKREQSMGHNWQFYGYGPCPRPAGSSGNPYTAVCAQFKNEVRKFNVLAFELEKFNSHKNWSVVGCPITNTTLCATTHNEKRIFKDRLAYDLVKFVTGKDWLLEPCPDLATPVCFKLENDTQIRDILSNRMPSLELIPCVAEETTTTSRGITEMETSTLGIVNSTDILVETTEASADTTPGATTEGSTEPSTKEEGVATERATTEGGLRAQTTTEMASQEESITQETEIQTDDNNREGTQSTSLETTEQIVAAQEVTGNEEVITSTVTSTANLEQTSGETTNEKIDETKNEETTIKSTQDTTSETETGLEGDDDVESGNENAVASDTSETETTLITIGTTTAIETTDGTAIDTATITSETA